MVQCSVCESTGKAKEWLHQRGYEPSRSCQTVLLWTFSKFQNFCECKLPPVESRGDNRDYYYPRGWRIKRFGAHGILSTLASFWPCLLFLSLPPASKGLDQLDPQAMGEPQIWENQDSGLNNASRGRVSKPTADQCLVTFQWCHSSLIDFGAGSHMGRAGWRKLSLRCKDCLLRHPV